MMNSTAYPVQTYGGLPEDFTLELFNDKHIPMSPPNEDFGPYTYLLQSQPAPTPMMMPLLWEHSWDYYAQQQQEPMFENEFPIAPLSPPLSTTTDDLMVNEELVSALVSPPAPKKRQASQGIYRCQQCDKDFTRPYNLKSHMRTHTNEKPYCCDAKECTWRFARPHDLKRHQLLHSGHKPHECMNCKRRFARRDALRRHWKVDMDCGEAVERANAMAPQRRGRGRKCQ